MTLELLRRLTQAGTMYLIPADIHNKHIIRYTVTSQFTTPDDILQDWSLISKAASTLVAGTRALNDAKHPESGKDEVIGDNEKPILETSLQKKEDDFKRDKAEVELWIDKDWNHSRRPMRSLSCNSEPLPYTYFKPMHGYECKGKPMLKDAAAVLPEPSSAGSDPEVENTEMPCSLLGKQVLKKLTKFYSVPSFCNQWVRYGRHQVCCPLKGSQAVQKHLSSTCRTNCMSPTPVTSAVSSATSLETATAPNLL